MRRYASAQGEHVGGHVEHAEKRSGEQFSDDGDDHAADQGGDDGRVHGVAHRFAAASSDGVGDDDVRAESDADEQVEDESGDGRVGADGRDRGGAVGLGEVADDHDAGCVEELFQNAGRRHGERESQDFRPYAPVQHVYALLVVHHVLPPPAAAGSSFASEGIVVAAPNEGTAMPFCRML